VHAVLLPAQLRLKALRDFDERTIVPDALRKMGLAVSVAQ